jgi:hypothetical protein
MADFHCQNVYKEEMYEKRFRKFKILLPVFHFFRNLTFLRVEGGHFGNACSKMQ